MLLSCFSLPLPSSFLLMIPLSSPCGPFSITPLLSLSFLLLFHFIFFQNSFSLCPRESSLYFSLHPPFISFVVISIFFVLHCFDLLFVIHLSSMSLSTSPSPSPTPSSKYRPTSEQHNDNFSLSTIAEGSHPNVRKLCDTPPNVPHARALAYYDNIICQVTWFSPLSCSLPSASPLRTLPGPPIPPLPP